LKRKLQIALSFAIAVAAIRTTYILYERHQENAQQAAKPQAPPLNADYYVTPRRLHAYDKESAKQLTQQPVWVKLGYASIIFPYDPARHRSNFSHEAGKLLPLEKLDIKDVITDASPGSPDQGQVMAVFQKDGKSYAFAIGSVKEGSYQIYADDMLFIQDPHELYKHWPADIWQSIDNHEVKPGMSELQTSFAIGLGIPEGSGESAVKTFDYPNGGKPLRVTFSHGKATQITPGT
jgi:hypothetical protein